MLFVVNRFVILEENSLEFLREDGYPDELEEAIFFDSTKEAESFRNTLDYKDEFSVVEVRLTYEVKREFEK